MFEFIEITAQYSNAVLVAIMPYISDFSSKLQLPILQPITPAHVRQFNCSPRTDHVGGYVQLTNGYEFTFDRGRVATFTSPRSFFTLQNPRMVPHFFGSPRLSERDAMAIARRTVAKLGYDEKKLGLDRAPQITPPPQSGTNIVSRFRITWMKLEESPARRAGAGVDVEVDANTGQVWMLSLLNTNTWRADPSIAVRPTILSNRFQNTPTGSGRRVTRASAEIGTAFLNAILPQISEYVQKAELGIKSPLSISDIDMTAYDFGYVEGRPRAFLYLKSGDRFVYNRGQVVCFDARDSVRIPPPGSVPKEKPIEEFLGAVNVTTAEALATATNALVRLGYKLEVLDIARAPSIATPRKYGTNFFARYFISWRSPEHESDLVTAEVDATTRRIKSLYVNERVNTNIWRDDPIISATPEAK